MSTKAALTKPVVAPAVTLTQMVWGPPGVSTDSPWVAHTTITWVPRSSVATAGWVVAGPPRTLTPAVVLNGPAGGSVVVVGAVVVPAARVSSDELEPPNVAHAA